MTHCDHDPRIRVEEDDCGFIVTEYGDSSAYWTHRCPTIEAAARPVRALGFEPRPGAGAAARLSSAHLRLSVVIRNFLTVTRALDV